MTRFARAKGSKSSNERVPEDSTPWEVMKEQLLHAKKESEEAKKREEAEKQRIENYENFLKEHKSQKRKATWCDFPEAESNKSDNSHAQPKLKKKNKNKQNQKTTSATLTSTSTLESNVSTLPSKKIKNKKQKTKPNEIVSSVNDKQNKAEPTGEAGEEQQIFPKKKKLKKLKQKQQNSEKVLEVKQHGEHIGKPQDQCKENKRSKNKKIPSESSPVTQDNDNNVSLQQKTKFSDPHGNNNQSKKKKKDKKLLEGVPVRRKPINDHSFQFIINGKEVELVRFDGFPIMKRDAERLEELKSNMIKKGIPKSEVNRTLKLERRRAEKALARLKRDVCYNCRKGGHNLSDCPELKTKIPGVGAADGVCFKCGSTEHRQFECKVQKDKEFRFATCFICKEPGHIARQCPDNPKGLYPNGGGCKLCGDVTHLRKDCPTVMGKREETSIKLQTLDSNDNLEYIEQKMKNAPEDTSKKPKKIKF